MYFKSLEISGFKSFLNKTKLKFEPGVTAVVGPNGCGKSNIVDSIKWVLGEQSTKSMRSASMLDVIFNGTEKYEAVNFAEVSLTLSNEDRALPIDYDEVTISRRLFRSGESEYLLNKTPVRLTDVRNILMGTGIGTSSYSIVEQGRMDLILSSKPEERRYVFEEASGITRYKTKKREALMKLERVQENLTRINDIIHEVERQIKVIERQARKAERYKAQYEALKDLEVKYAYKKFKDLSSNDVFLDTSGVELKELSEKLVAGINEDSNALTALREEYNRVLEGLQSSKNEMMRLSTDMEKNVHTVEINGERIKELQKSVERMDWEIEEITGRKDDLKIRLDSLEVRFGEVSGIRAKKEEELLCAEENVKDLTASIEKHKTALISSKERTVDVVSDETKVKNALIKMDADIQNGQMRMKRLRIEKQNVCVEKEKITEELKAVELREKDISAELEEKRKLVESCNEEFNSKQNKFNELNEQKRDKERRINEIRPQRQFLEKLLSEREGINESAKDIMKRKESGDDRFAGVHGILSELVNVKDEYEETMEALLGSAAQALVVDTRDIAQSVSGYLKENHLESVYFIILEELNKPSARAQEACPTVGLNDIGEVLFTNEHYREALKNLLGGIYVSGDPDKIADLIVADSGFEGKVIFEKGEIIQKGMRRSRNHSHKEVIPLFGRREKIEKMQREEDEITAVIQTIDLAIAELAEWLKTGKIRKDALEKELAEKQIFFADIVSKKASVKEKCNSLSEEVLILDTEIEEEEVIISGFLTEKQDLSSRLAALESENIKLQEMTEEEQKAVLLCTTRREETLFLMSDIKAELSGVRMEENNLKENLERERTSFDRIAREVEDKRNQIKENGERILRFEDEIRTLQERNAAFSVELENKTKGIDEIESKKNALSGEINKLQERVKAKEFELEKARNETRDVDIRTKEVEYKKGALVERILSTYKVNLSELNVELEENTNWEEIESKIGELKEYIEKMGEVSLGAVEEHKELQERFAFLTKQRDDLAASRESLLEAITKINRTTKKLFME
ncbi:MAG: chromosome segregation protein SMC, partial [Candidatus Omnitrophica bacterium]|nr:chromosome segregation protein SMC [Candidatus Omnitrophota bacterium]